MRSANLWKISLWDLDLECRFLVNMKDVLNTDNIPVGIATIIVAVVSRVEQRVNKYPNQLNELNELSYLFRSALFNNTKFWEDAQLKKTTLRLSFVNTTCGYTVLFFVYVPLFTNNNTSLTTNSKWKMSYVWRRDSNLQPLNQESQPLTTDMSYCLYLGCFVWKV